MPAVHTVYTITLLRLGQCARVCNPQFVDAAPNMLSLRNHSFLAIHCAAASDGASPTTRIYAPHTGRTSIGPSFPIGPAPIESQSGAYNPRDECHHLSTGRVAQWSTRPAWYPKVWL